MSYDLIYAGKNLSEFGLIWDNKRLFDKPENLFTRYEIPARNGDLLEAQKKFKNVQISYRCYIRTEFRKNFSDLVNYLNSFTTYQKLENTLEPEVFRMGLFHSAINPDVGNFALEGWVTLVFDCKPQEYYTDGAEFERIIPHSDIYTGNPAKVVNEGESSVISLRVGLEPMQDLNGYDSPWVGGAGKNKLPPSTTQTSNGVTFTVNSDGTVTATRTASSTNNAEYDFTVPSSLYGKQVVLNGCPSGGADSGTYRMFFLVNGSRQATDYGNGATYTIPSSPTSCVVRINVFKDFNSTATFKPMIRDASITDATYEPYANVCPIYPANGKNYLQITATSQTVNGVTFTVNADGTVKANGTASSAAEFVIKSDVSGNTYAGMILSGCPNGGGGSTYRLFEQVQGSPWTYLASDGGGGATLPTTTYATVRFVIRVESGVSVNNLVFKPMIRPASITDSTYVPYQSIVVTRTGKNLLKYPYRDASGTTSFGITYTVASDGTVYANGTATENSTFYLTNTMTHSEFPNTMVLNGNISRTHNSFLRVQIAESPWTVIGDDIGNGVQFSIPNDGKKYQIIIRVERGQTVNNLAFKPMVRIASVTDATYEPYQGQTYTIDLNGTRYGGTVDLATGVLTVTRASITLNSANMNNSETYPGWSNAGIRAIIGTGLDRQIDVQLNIGQRIGVNTMSNYDVVYLPVYVYGMNQTQWKAKAMDVQIVAEYATPQTVQLTAQQISLLTGINYISSSGEVTVTTSTPLILKNPSPMTAKPVFKFNNITAPFTVSANGETIISFQNAIRLVRGGIVNNMFFNATGTNLIMQKQGTPNYEETSFLINSGWLPAGRYYLATMPIGNLEVTSMDGTHLYSSGGTFTLTDITQVKIWYVITPDASTPQNFNFPIFLRPLGTLYVDSKLMDCYMLDGDTAYSFNECVSLPKDFLQLDERTVMTITSGAVGFIAPNWWRL